MIGEIQQLKTSLASAKEDVVAEKQKAALICNSRDKVQQVCASLLVMYHLLNKSLRQSGFQKKLNCNHISNIHFQLMLGVDKM